MIRRLIIQKWSILSSFLNSNTRTPSKLTKLDVLSACRIFLCHQVTFSRCVSACDSMCFTVTVSHVCVAVLGCPPLQGSEGSQQNFMGVLETAMRIANEDAEDEEEDGPREGAKVKIINKINKCSTKWSSCYCAANKPGWFPFNQSMSCFIVCRASFCARILNCYPFPCCTSCLIYQMNTCHSKVEKVVYCCIV